MLARKMGQEIAQICRQLAWSCHLRPEFAGMEAVMVLVFPDAGLVVNLWPNLGEGDTDAYRKSWQKML